ncbi:MAG: lamin tail domain-containing protein [Cyclobacteriaceae bacterium]
MTLPVKVFAPLLVLIFSQTCYSQVADSFSDNDFTSNPEWVGDGAKFTIESFQLKLQAPTEASMAYLTTVSESINNAIWEFKVTLDFNPSSSNLAKVYLVSDQGDLTNSLNGYFVMIGGTADEISLYQQAGLSASKLIDGSDGSVNQSMVNVTIKATRDDAGNWELLSDVGNTGTFYSEGTAFDNTFNASSYFGIVCIYTSTRSDKFFFDDFNVVGDPYVDVDPPALNEIEVLSPQELLLRFNEPIDPTAADKNVYTINNLINPTEAIIEPDGKSVKLSFNQPFQNGLTSELTVSEVKDLTGNALSTTKTFLYFQPTPTQAKDIIFTEIFADPSPQISLPDAEYVEVYNRSENPINIFGWILSDGSSNATLPDKIILPNEYYVITASSNVSKFGMGSPVLGVSNFPTLNNTSDTLTIKITTGETIDSLNYHLSWYKNIDKQEGGWSLELIDTNNPCGDEENWAASENKEGGTPGRVNSINANKPDLTGPQLSSVNILSNTQLLLSFNEKLESPISNSAVFSVSPNIEVIDYSFTSKSLRTIVLELNSELISKQLYEVTANNIFDCNGNKIDSELNKLTFALHENPEPGDLLINEILFDPKPNGVDFVELYNHSDKYINLKEVKIGNINGESVENDRTLSTSDHTIAPSAYYVFTSNPITLKSYYPQGKEERFLTLSLPSFPDDEGSVALTNSNGAFIDHLYYSKDFHSSFIKDEEGVSLERISFSSITNARDNWASASSNAGFATPGYANSNFRPDPTIDIGKVEVNPPIFTPSSGNSDFSQISFQFDQPGFVANVKILDHQGRLIKTVANNEVLSYSGSFRWDGDTEDGNKARAGYYLVWFEVFNSSGSVQTYRKRVIVASR